MARILWTHRRDIGPIGRFNHRMAYDSNRNRTVLFGGADNQTWEWDGDNWTQMNDIGPAARIAHQLAFESVRQRTLCFGGAANRGVPTNLFGDTWEWDGQDWTQMADTGPSPRSDFAMAYAVDRARTVLFGGVIGNSFVNDTWEWDGAEWTQVADSGPTPRDACGAAYDTVRQRLVLFGGEVIDQSNQISAAGDTWEFDGIVWTQVSLLGPGPVIGPPMTFGNGQTVLLHPNGSTWQWDGRHWTERQDIGPGARNGTAIAYDSKRNHVVLFGGAGANGFLHDTWEMSETPLPA